MPTSDPNNGSVVPAVPPAGIFVPVPTFFTPSTTATVTPALDTATQVAHSLFLARSGITGLVLLGSTGEAVHLTRTERTQLLTDVRKGLTEGGFPNYPLMAGTATNSVVETLELLQESKDAGADYGLVLAPNYFAAAGADEEGLIAWFTTVADASPLPVLFYNYPGVSNGLKASPPMVRKLAQHKNIVGCKFSHGDISAHAQVALSPEVDSEGFRVFTGLGQQLLPMMVVGGAGAIDGLAAFFPRTVMRLWTLANSGTVGKEARELQFKVSSAEELVVRWGTAGIKDAVARVAGFGEVGLTRAPLRRGMPKGEWEKWGGVIGEMQTVESRLKEEAEKGVKKNGN